MEYFKPVTLSSWSVIQKICLNAWDGQFTMAKVFSGPELETISKLIAKDILDTYKIQTRVKTAIMFINDAHFVQDMHVDGFKVDRKGASNTALNVPILNCEHCPMHWYNGSYVLEENPGFGLGYLKLKWEYEPVKVASVIVDNPMFVKIDVPHRIENLNSTPRLMLSVRFVEDILLENIPNF